MVAKREQTREDLEAEKRLYKEMMDHYQNEFYAIVRGKLYHSPDVQEVRRMLRDEGIDPSFLVHLMCDQGPPYWV